MSTCTRCECTGFLNVGLLPEGLYDVLGADGVQQWLTEHHDECPDVTVCDCCGDGSDWYEMPGEHNESDYGPSGPYAYNGGLPKCCNT